MNMFKRFAQWFGNLINLSSLRNDVDREIQRNVITEELEKTAWPYVKRSARRKFDRSLRKQGLLGPGERFHANAGK